MNLGSLQRIFRGEIVTPESPAYDGARRIWNGMIDRRPAAILRCTDADDVAAAVRFSAENDLYPAIRAGGHNVAGLAMVDKGIVIDVTGMRNIVVDPRNRTAKAQTGLTWGEFDAETQKHGLATTGGIISSTGIAGLTLGGGVGWLLGRCGLVCDNTLRYEMVTATGERIAASVEENPDLFWALKGGGGNFGVVTSIQYRLYPVTTVISGMILYPRARAREVLRAYRDFVLSGIPDELIVYAAAICTPDGVPVIALVPCYSGEDLSEGERLIEPLRHFGSPIADLVTRMPYTDLQRMLDAAAPFGIRSYWKSGYLSGLPEQAIETFVSYAEQSRAPRSLYLFEHAHGASSRVAPDATAFTSRTAPFDLVLVTLWDDPAEDAQHMDHTRQFFSAMQEWSAGTVYVNALSEDEGSRVQEAYGNNLPRLRAIKARYDPENRFRRNHNIQPAAQAAGR